MLSPVSPVFPLLGKSFPCRGVGGFPPGGLGHGHHEMEERVGGDRGQEETDTGSLGASREEGRLFRAPAPRRDDMMARRGWSLVAE